jgi:hypothetical protein
LEECRAEPEVNKKPVVVDVVDPQVPAQVAESGHIEYGSIEINHEIVTVQLTHKYVNPVVIMGTLSYNGHHPSTVRVKNVKSDSFDV